MEAIPLPPPESFRQAVERIIGVDVFLVASFLLVLAVLIACAVVITWKVASKVRALDALVASIPSMAKIQEFLDGAAQRYQGSIIDLTKKMKDILEEEHGKQANFLTDVTKGMESLRKNAITTDRSIQKIKAALPLLVPAERAEAVTHALRED